MIPKQHVPGLTRDGDRFSHKIMLKQKSTMRREVAR